MATGGGPIISRLPDDIWKDETLARRFRVEKELGIGGQAIVVIAYHLELDERVALKFLLPEVAQSTASVARFRREARAAAKIKNEHVVRIIDVCSTQAGLPYIVMEYLDGRDLERVLQNTKDSRLAIPDAVDFVLQASEALAEGHRLGIVHRDLKPANLFCVDRDDGFPMIKVLDFGISKIKPLVGDVERTDRYEILGSPRYMSPEQIDASRDVDQRSDIWSLGVILYQTLAGRVPFEGEIVPDLWHKIRTDTPRALAELRRGVPPALNSVVMKCLEKERSRRYANLGELADALACVAPERSRGSIARILRMTGTRPRTTNSSIPTMTSDPTLVARSLPTASLRRRSTVVIGLGLGATVMAGLAVTRLVAVRSEVPQVEHPLVTMSHPALLASTATDKPSTPDTGNTSAQESKAPSSKVATPKLGPARGITPPLRPHAASSALARSASAAHDAKPPRAPAMVASISTDTGDKGRASGGSPSGTSQPSATISTPNASSSTDLIALPALHRKKQR